MRRGFKAEAERTAQRTRSGMGLRPAEPMDSLELAKHAGAEVRSADQLVTIAKLEAPLGAFFAENGFGGAEAPRRASIRG